NCSQRFHRSLAEANRSKRFHRTHAFTLVTKLQRRTRKLECRSDERAAENRSWTPHSTRQRLSTALPFSRWALHSSCARGSARPRGCARACSPSQALARCTAFSFGRACRSELWSRPHALQSALSHFCCCGRSRSGTNPDFRPLATARSVVRPVRGVS